MVAGEIESEIVKRTYVEITSNNNTINVSVLQRGTRNNKQSGSVDHGDHVSKLSSPQPMLVYGVLFCVLGTSN